MSSDKITIFFAGATGFIGGSVLQRLLAHPKAGAFDITVLVRNEDKAKVFETKFGLKAVVGSLQDLSKLADLAENAHVVINVADSEDVNTMKAILSGLKRRHANTGDKPILIHTSGIGLFFDDSRGAYTSPTIYSDLDLPTLDALPPTAWHRPVDLLVIGADTDGYARTHLVIPSPVYGIGAGPLYDLGLAKKHSIELPILADAFLKRGRAGIVGTGAGRWPNVHVEDTADVYVRLLDAILADPSGVRISHGREGYFIVENGEHSTYELVQAIGAALVALGRAQEAEPTELSPEERVQYLGSDQSAYVHFSNARCRAERARKELGWMPEHTTADFLVNAREEVEAALARQVASV